MQVAYAPEKAAGQTSADARKNSQRAAIVCLLVVACVVAANSLWFALDRRVPSTDEAGHILNGIQYHELFKHFRPWKLTWLHDFLSVNPFYPPAVYIYDGLLKTVLGPGRWVDTVCFVSYTAVLTASTFGLAWFLSRCSAVAAVAAILVNIYPQTAHLSHMYMLDLPLAAMVAAGLFALAWWRDNPTPARTVACGAILAAACFTKQLGAMYLVPACAWMFFAGNKRSKLQLVGMAGIVASVMVPWFLVNVQWIRSYAAENAVVLKGLNLNPVLVFGDYLHGLTFSMSPILVVAVIGSLLVLPRVAHRELAFVYASTIGGLALTSLLSVTIPLDRYSAPALVGAAIATAYGARQVIRLHRTLGLAVVSTVLLVGLAQYVSFAFSPPALEQLSYATGTRLREYAGVRIHKSAPRNGLIWGQDWIVDTIARRDGKAPVWVNILPSDGHYNPHSFELLCHEKGLAIKPTTSRRWTMLGDTVEFSPKSALWYHWYVIKSGNQGNHFKDAASAAAYQELVDFVSKSGRFELADTYGLPGGSTLSLYRQR